jgi:transposase-like protein
VARKRRKHSAQFKFKVALAAAKGDRTINEIASEYNLHPNLVSNWKKQLLTEGPMVFNSSTARELQEQEAREIELYEQIGRLKMELEWVKKKLPYLIETKRAMIDTDHPTLSIRRQCELVGLNRSTFYLEPAGESRLNLQLMRLIDEEYTRAPFYGYRKMTARLNDPHGYQVNHKRVARLMQKMGLQAVYPRPRTSIPDKQHKKYPYLLRGLDITPVKSSLGSRYHIRTDAAGVHVPGRDHGLVQSLRGCLAAIEHTRRCFLSGRLALGAAARSAGNLQHRPGRSVHGARFHRRAGRGENSC